MDITQIATALLGGILSVATVSAFVIKYATQSIKYVHLAKDAISALDHVITSLEDGKLSPDEVDLVKNDIAAFKADLKK